MSEFAVQILASILATTAIALAIVTVVTDNFPKWQHKPFNCLYCMTWWVAFTIGGALGLWWWIPVIQICAYIVYQKLI